MKRFLIVCMALLFVSVSAFADAADAGKNLTVRTFQFRHKQAEKAAAMVKPLISSEGSFTIQPSSNALVITDSPENLKKIMAALTEFDAPAQDFHVTVRLVSAGRGGKAGGHVSAELRDIESKLALLRYDVVESLGSAEVEGKEGEPGLVDLKAYRADFKFGEYDPASDTVRIADFKLSKLDGDQLSPVMKTTLNLKLGQTVILAVTRDPQSQRALMMVLSARR